MIDSHCHLNFDKIKNNFHNVLDNIKNNNITSLLSINTDPNDFPDHYELIKDYQSIFLSYGLHPEYVSSEKKISKNLITTFANRYEKIIGIGETGLDFYHSKDYTKEQYNCFEQHIMASIETNLPLIIHQRNSETEIMDVLNSYLRSNNLKVVFHCFTGSEKLKNFCLDNNFYISLSGIITFKNASELRNTIRDIPLSSILIETDSPFLAPSPFRGKINEPSYVKYIAEYLAIFFNLPLEKIIKNTDDNFYNLFSKAIRYNKFQ